MQYDKADRSEGIRDKLLPLIPKDLYGKPEFLPQMARPRLVQLTNCPSFRIASIDQSRNSTLLDLSSTFDHIMARFFQDCDRIMDPNYERAKAGYVFQELYRLSIWPISTRLNTINLDYIQTAIAGFHEQKDTSFKDKLVSWISRAVSAQKGLCLSCVRKGKVSMHQGNCQARLRYLCTG